MVHGSEVVSYSELVRIVNDWCIQKFVAQKNHTDHLSLVLAAGGNILCHDDVFKSKVDHRLIWQTIIKHMCFASRRG